MSKIFLSHASPDSPTAQAVAEWLAANGWDDYFLDFSQDGGISPGERWQEALKKAADRCEAVIFFLSPAWRDSRWCVAEYLLAKQLGKAIFGVLIEPTPFDTLPADMAPEWQICDLVAGDEREYFQVHEDGVFPPTAVSLSAQGLARLKHGLQQAGLDAATFPWPPASDPKRRPYRGLRALDIIDAAVFFGRDAALVRALDKLRSLRQQGVDWLFVILGASGAGKSSFLRAGLLPRLARDDRHFFPLPVIRPEQTAISGATGLAVSIEAAFQRLGVRKNLGDICDKLDEPQGFTAILDELRVRAHTRIAVHTTPPSSRQGMPGPSARDGNQPISPTLLITIDQGEELFGADDGGQENQRLLAMLREVVTVGADPKWLGSNEASPQECLHGNGYDGAPSSPEMNEVVPINPSVMGTLRFAHPTSLPTASAQTNDAASERPIILIAIRSDSYERLQTDPHLKGIEQTLFSLPPLPREEYKEIIEGPPARQSATGKKQGAAGEKPWVEPALIQQLIQDAPGRPMPCRCWPSPWSGCLSTMAAMGTCYSQSTKNSVGPAALSRQPSSPPSSNPMTSP